MEGSQESRATQFSDIPSDPRAQAVVDEYFGIYRSTADAGDESAVPSVGGFLSARGVEVPAGGTLSIRFTDAARGVTPLRPDPGCPGGYCVPERCPDGVKQCGWICHCP